MFHRIYVSAPIDQETMDTFTELIKGITTVKKVGFEQEKLYFAVMFLPNAPALQEMHRVIRLLDKVLANSGSGVIGYEMSL